MQCYLLSITFYTPTSIQYTRSVQSFSEYVYVLEGQRGPEGLQEGQVDLTNIKIIGRTLTTFLVLLRTQSILQQLLLEFVKYWIVTNPAFLKSMQDHTSFFVGKV